jgi:hypothetical protein
VTMSDAYRAVQYCTEDVRSEEYLQSPSPAINPCPSSPAQQCRKTKSAPRPGPCPHGPDRSLTHSLCLRHATRTEIRVKILDSMHAFSTPHDAKIFFTLVCSDMSLSLNRLFAFSCPRTPGPTDRVRVSCITLKTRTRGRENMEMQNNLQHPILVPVLLDCGALHWTRPVGHQSWKCYTAALMRQGGGTGVSDVPPCHFSVHVAVR